MPGEDSRPGTEVTIRPSGLRVTVGPGETLFAAARRDELSWPTACFGQGTCTRCRCRVVEGAEFTKDVAGREAASLRRAPDVEQGPGELRLACQLTFRRAGQVVVQAAGVSRGEQGPLDPPDPVLLFI